MIKLFRGWIEKLRKAKQTKAFRMGFETTMTAYWLDAIPLANIAMVENGDELTRTSFNRGRAKAIEMIETHLSCCAYQTKWFEQYRSARLPIHHILKLMAAPFDSIGVRIECSIQLDARKENVLLIWRGDVHGPQYRINGNVPVIRTVAVPIYQELISSGQLRYEAVVKNAIRQGVDDLKKDLRALKEGVN